MRYKINHHDKKAIIMTSKSTLDPSDFHSMDKKQTFKKICSVSQSHTGLG